MPVMLFFPTKKLFTLLLSINNGCQLRYTCQYCESLLITLQFDSFGFEVPVVVMSPMRICELAFKVTDPVF